MGRRQYLGPKQDWVIYGLTDPSSGVVKYVGFTSQQPPTRRFKWHIRHSVKHDTYLGHWLQKIISSGQVPGFTILKTGHGDGWKDAEREMIAEFSKISNLCNHTDGGDGGYGQTGNSAASLEKMRRHGIEQMSDPAARARHSAFMKSYMADPLNRENVREKMKQLRSTPSAREHQSQISKKLWESGSGLRRSYTDLINFAKRNAGIKKSWTPERRAEQAKRMRGQRQAIKAAQDAAWNDPTKREQRLEKMRLNSTAPESLNKLREKANREWVAVKASGCRTLKEYKEQYLAQVAL